ncbi:hypothetical protein HK097_007091 [Rhizophlyctis rosea]|uniref:Arginine N-methyltransferase 2 n=1 Tax=Rhizophlyctis rosea TaxID=64517 RepID=A0AAD5SE87_9FUNG|nr:hypothetical protein HK097_007091 [Rhizophlyctis rosea]
MGRKRYFTMTEQSDIVSTTEHDTTVLLLDYLASLTPSTPSPASQIGSFLSQGADLLHRDSTTGTTPLHIAARSGNTEAVTVLLGAGHPWNVVDNTGKSVGEVAKEAGWDELYEELVEEGVRVEFVLGVLEKAQTDDETETPADASSQTSSPNPLPDTLKSRPQNLTESTTLSTSYLSSSLTYTADTLTDTSSNAVMMSWETPLMILHTTSLFSRRAFPTSEFHILNVGFGLGIVDSIIQSHKPTTHTIIEAHPDVYKKMIADGWDKKEGVEVIFSKWQDALENGLLTRTYDAIFFDTFGENYDDLHSFHEHLPNLLTDESSTYSFFNGLAGTNQFFHDVACRMVELDLAEMGIETEWVEVDVGKLGDNVWQGMRRKYWSLNGYRLPVCRLVA